jgi:hypothetical protein
MSNPLENATNVDELEDDTASVHRHDLDVVSVAFGAIFAVLGFVFLIGDVDASGLSSTWGWVAFLGALGVVLVALGARLHRRP